MIFLDNTASTVSLDPIIRRPDDLLRYFHGGPRVPPNCASLHVVPTALQPSLKRQAEAHVLTLTSGAVLGQLGSGRLVFRKEMLERLSSDLALRPWVAPGIRQG